MKLSGAFSMSSTPAHLVCRQTPQTSHAIILSPSSSSAPHVHSTTQFSVPFSIRNLPSFPSPATHLPRICTIPSASEICLMLFDSESSPNPTICCGWNL
ncbi:hypothetical protein AXF42_Ash012779 [Apostasia shenzhenica]|uniref:Uncharacterized protein n=1 Tax=Apostasia shenzhenica TaxID=1088818 RepID=A0A2I0AM72_9ASPA|nr:hypothetical protein AXF42_Ash012779 [Apostasia shenzhenica]